VGAAEGLGHGAADRARSAGRDERVRRPGCRVRARPGAGPARGSGRVPGDAGRRDAAPREGAAVHPASPGATLLGGHGRAVQRLDLGCDRRRCQEPRAGSGTGDRRRPDAGPGRLAGGAHLSRVAACRADVPRGAADGPHRAQERGRARRRAADAAELRRARRLIVGSRGGAGGSGGGRADRGLAGVSPRRPARGLPRVGDVDEGRSLRGRRAHAAHEGRAAPSPGDGTRWTSGNGC
jgi:hypothetical protein